MTMHEMKEDGRDMLVQSARALPQTIDVAFALRAWWEIVRGTPLRNQPLGRAEV